MKIILTYLSILSFFFVSAQNISFLNKVIDEEGNPIPIATIFLQSNQVATTSDFDGNFKLVFSKTSLPDTIIIRHITYETQKIFINKENIKSIETIVLKTKENQIGESVVFALSAEKVIEKAIANINKNYFKNTFFIDGFYRQTHKENDKFVRLIECYATVKEDISNRFSTAQKEKFYISKIRRSNVYERNGDQHGDHLVDLFSEDPINYAYSSFLNIKAYRQYEFSFGESSETQLIKIYFQNKSWTEAQNKTGYVLINKYDYAIVEMEITSTQNPLDKSYNKSDWKFQNGTYKVIYEKYDGFYMCKQSTKYYNHYVLNEHTKNAEYIVEEYFDWTKDTLNIMENVEDFNFKSFSNLYSKYYNYKKNYWTTREPINQKIIDDLNSFMDLEKQFEDD